MTISFSQIPIALRTPGTHIEIDNTNAVTGLPGIAKKILLIGQRLAAGTVAAGVPTRITSVSGAEGAFGRGSMLHGMFAALKPANSLNESWAVALDDAGGGVQAVGGLLITGPATKAGTIHLYIGGRAVRVAVASGAAQNAIATAVAAAINAATDLPVTAAVDGVVLNQVNVTARHKGEAGNHIDLRLNFQQGEALPAGVGVAITAMTGGTTNPGIAPAIAAIGDTQYHEIAMPYTDTANLTALEAELERRWDALVQVEGHAFGCAPGSHAAISTLGNSRNSPFVTLLGRQGTPWSPWEVAACLAGVDALEPDPARPRQTLPLTGMPAPAEADRYTQAEQNIHLYDGIATFYVDAGGVCRVQRLVTTYQTNPLGAEDVSYLDRETVDTAAFLRFSVNQRIALKFPRHKLANDGTAFAPGQAIVTPADIRDELIALFLEWELAGLAEGRGQFKRDLIVERSAADQGRVDAEIPPDVINQFRLFAGKLKFLL
jgi:phage tail sheath gpL-like